MALYDEISEEKRKDIGEYIHRKWTESKNSGLRKRVISEMKDARDAYDQIPSSEELWEDAINLVLPFVTISIDQLEPRLVASIVAHDEIVQVEDRGKMDEQLSKDIEVMDNSVLKDDIKIKEAVKEHVHDILLDGHVYVSPYWDFREGKVREFVSDEFGVPQGIPEEGVPEGLLGYAGKLVREKVVKTNNRAQLDMLDSECVFLPDRVDDWEEVALVYEHFVSLGEYRGKVRRGVHGWVKHEEETEEELEGKLYEKRPDTGKVLSEGEEEDKGIRAMEGEKLKAEFRCLQGHIMYDADDDGIEEKLVCIVEESTKKILYLVNNAELDPLNRKQIRKIVLIPRSGTGYGYNLYSKLKMIQEGGSNTANIVLNSCIIQMMPFFFYEEAAGFEDQTIELYPGAGIKVGDVKRILMNTFQPNAGAFKDIIDIFFQLWNYIVTLPDYSLGREPASEGSTATGVLALLQEASVSHDYLGSRLHDQYEEIFRIIHDLCYLNMDPVREMDTLGYSVPQKVLSNSYKVSLVSTTKSANRHIERMEMKEALEIGELGVKAGVVVPDEPIRDYLELFRNVNVEKWMNGPVSQVANRLRESLGMDGTKTEEGGAGSGEVADPFGEIVMQLVSMPPDMLLQFLQTLQVGKKVKDEMTELVGGPMPGPEEMGEGMGGNGGSDSGSDMGGLV